MRTTGTNYQAAHVWAQDKGDLMRSKSMKAEDEFLYSYSAVIARWVSAPNGDRVPLITSYGYSVTTSHHVSLAWRAIGYNEKTFRVPLPRESYADVDHEKNRGYLVDMAEGQAAKAMRSRDNAHYARDHTLSLKETADTYVMVFELTPNVWTDIWDKLGPKVESIIARQKQLANETIEEREKRLGPARAARDRLKRETIERREREYREQQERWAAEALVTNAERVQKWRNGENAYYPHTYGAPAELRLKPGTTDTVQTSQGAEFPLEDATKIFERLRQYRASQGPYNYNNPSAPRLPLGHFNVDSFDGSIIKAGCHTVTWDEAVRFMNSLGG